MAFTHLHVHTEYSLLDGAARIKKVVARAKELGMDSLAITDHGVMFGAVDFYRECQAQGIKPVIGCEVYVAKRTRFDKDAGLDKGNNHLILLAETDEGYHNLIKIVSRSFTEGYYYKPRVDLDLLREFSSGIIATSACLAGNVQQSLLNKDYASAKEWALTYLDIFGEGNFFLELQDQGLPEEADILPDMKRLHDETGIPFVATNDVHYVNKEDAKAHDVLLCIQTGSTIDEEDRLRFANDEYYLKSEEEMRKLFAGFPEAIENTHQIAMRCNVEFEFGNYHIPDFEAPEGMDNEAYLRQLCEDGLKERYGEEPSKDLKERLDYELSVIISMGYVEYFLIVWDFINYAKSNGIMVGPGRGSAAGSIVAYCLKITNIDPIKYGLIFERFLNPERVSMPDIDVDFCYERRGEVIDYVIRKYGKEKVSQIVTFGTMKAKQAVRDVGRVFGVSYKETDDIAKAIPFDLHITIDKALEMNPELKEQYENNDTVRKVLDMAKAIEGMPRNTSTHAAGVVISKKAIEEYVPLYLSDKGVATQFTMTTIEELGLLKMDFLGLRNLTVIRDALEMIEENHGITIDLDNMTYDDPGVYDMISAGNTAGIFQLESSGMTQFMKNLKPDCFEDIVAGISLYRPGPMASIPTYIENKKHPENIKYLHDSLRPILSVTYGCMVYQEQVMQIVRDLAGYTYGHSDLLRRAMSKKKMDVMLSEKEVFMEGALKNGVPRETSEEIFNQMVSFASYAFNKSHAAAYAVVGYQTGYLKFNFPGEFMAALMTSVMGDSAQVAKYIRNSEEMGLKVLPPDINESNKKFTVTKDGSIRFGLKAIKNLGENAIDSIIETRKAKGAFKDFFEFMNEIDVHQVNKKSLESLIRSGALDSLEPNRAQLMAVYEELLESAQANAKDLVSGQMTLFQTNEDTMAESFDRRLPDVKNFDSHALSMMEKEMLGVFISGHPLDSYKDLIEKITTADHAILNEEGQDRIHDNDKVTVAGIISSVKTLITKNNRQMAFVSIEDFYGVTEIVVFPNVFERCAGLLEQDRIVIVRGTVNFKEDEAPKILADQITDIEDAADISGQEPLRHTFEGKTMKVRLESAEQADEIMKTALEYPGDDRLLVYFPGKQKPVRPQGGGVRVCPQLAEALALIAGPENVKY